MSDNNNLIDGIREITEKEIAELRAAADRFAVQKRESAETEAGRIRSEVETRVAAQAARILRRAKATTDNVRHRIALEAEEEIFALVLESVAKRFRELIHEPEYPGLLKRWIVEAAIGLEADRAFVQCSHEEREVCSRVLAAAMEEIREKTGRRVELELASGPPLAEQGVVLTAASGRTAYNNQLRTRLLRRESVVRRAIFEVLETEREGAAERTGSSGKGRLEKTEDKGRDSG